MRHYLLSVLIIIFVSPIAFAKDHLSYDELFDRLSYALDTNDALISELGILVEAHSEVLQEAGFEIRWLEKKIEKLNSEIKWRKQLEANLRSQLTTKQQEIGRLNSEIKWRKDANANLQSELQKLRSALAEAKSNQQVKSVQTATGPMLTPALLEAAFKSVSIEARMSVQAVLRARGFYKSSIDGIWGKGTSRALMDFAESAKMMRKSPSQVFNAALSGMNIKYSDERPSRNTPAYTSSKSGSDGLVAIVNRPSASASQAKSICRAEASNTASAYTNSRPPTGFNANCDTWGDDTVTCRGNFTRGGGGFLGGFGDAIDEAGVRNRAYRSCLARYGWAKK